MRVPSQEADEPEPESQSGHVDLRKRRLKRRVIVYGSLIGLLWGLYSWQPWEYDFIPRGQPAENPATDPDSATLFSPRARVLVVTAHPDDDEFYIAGTLLKLGQAGAITNLVICTSGDKSYYPFSKENGLTAIREAEQKEAAKRYHAREVIFLRHSDGRLRADRLLVDQIDEIIRRLKPTHVLCFDGDYPPRFSHQDHRRSGDAAKQAVIETAYPKWILRFSTSAPNYVVDITRQWDEKVKLLKIHKSQFHGDRLVRVTNMVESLAEQDGARIRKPYGEGFRVTRLR